jgi:hypothetical protein
MIENASASVPNSRCILTEPFAFFFTSWHRILLPRHVPAPRPPREISLRG